MSAPKKSYSDLAKEAIASIKDRTGSSAQAIKSYIIATYPKMNFQQVCFLFPLFYTMYHYFSLLYFQIFKFIIPNE